MDPSQRNKSLRCDYHRDHGHETDRCRSLKFLKEKLIKVNAIRTEGKHEKTKPIDGPISFPPINPNKVIVPHYDALVLTLCIHGFDVQVVLVDLGSVADLLKIPAFKQMKLSLGVVNSTRRILSGFNGATTVTLGDVMLPIKAGPVTQRVLFSIVEDLRPYNAIMGRAFLHSMKAILSIYNQMVNYLTNVRQVDLLSSQLEVRQCYQLYIKEQRGDKNPENYPLEDQIPR